MLIDGFGGSQTMAGHVLPHVLGAMAHIPTVRHSAHHRHAEVKSDMVV